MAVSTFLVLREFFQTKIMTFESICYMWTTEESFISITKLKEIEKFRRSESLG